MSGNLSGGPSPEELLQLARQAAGEPEDLPANQPGGPAEDADDPPPPPPPPRQSRSPIVKLMGWLWSFIWPDNWTWENVATSLERTAVTADRMAKAITQLSDAIAQVQIALRFGNDGGNMERRRMAEALRVFQDNPLELVKWENSLNLARMRASLGRGLMALLYIETALVFVLIFSQGTGVLPGYALYFHLDDTFFSIFVNATIIQVVALISIIVWSLFPNDKKKGDEKGDEAKMPSAIATLPTPPSPGELVQVAPRTTTPPAAPGAPPAPATAPAPAGTTAAVQASEDSPDAAASRATDDE